MFRVCKGFKNAKEDYWCFDNNESFNFYFRVTLGEFILCHSDNLSKTLQASHISAAEGQKIATMMVKTLQSIRKDDDLKVFWSRITASACKLDVSNPTLPRKRKLPRRYEIGTAEGTNPEEVEA